MEEMVAYWNPHKRIYLLKWFHTNSAVVLPEFLTHDRIVEEKILARILIFLREESSTFKQPDELISLRRLSC